MLDIFRKHRKHLLGIILTAVAIAFMLPFGLDSLRQGPKTRGEAIKVNNREISFDEYYRELERIRSLFRQQLGANYGRFSQMLNLEQRTIDDLINNTLLDEFIQKAGLTASTAQVEQEIESLPYFKGGVTKEAFANFLRAQGMTGAKLAKETRRQIVLSQLQHLFTDVNRPSEPELKTAFADQRRKSSFDYVSFNPSDFESKVDVSNEDVLKNYFNDHSEDHRIPKAVEFKFVSFPVAKFMGQVEVTNDDLREVYEQQKNNFSVPAEIHLRKMFFSTSPAKNDLEKLVLGEKKDDNVSTPSAKDQAKAKAQGALSRFNSGESFADLAKQFSEDPETAKKGGDMGWLLFGSLEKKLRDTASKLKTGEGSELIETDKGYYLLFAEERKERSVKPFEQVKGQLEESFRKSNAGQYAQAAAETFYSQLEASKSEDAFTEVAAKEGLPVLTTDKPLSRNDSTPNVPKGLAEKAISVNEGETELLEVGDTTYVVHITKVRDSAIPEFGQVKAQVEKSYRKEQSKILAKEAGEKALKKLQEENSAAKKTLQQFAKENSLEVKTIPLSARQAANQGPLASSDGSQIAFSLTKEQPIADRVIEADNKVFIVELTGTEEPTAEEFEKQRKQLEDSENQRSGARIMDGLLKQLRSEAEIWINPILLEKGNKQA